MDYLPTGCPLSPQIVVNQVAETWRGPYVKQTSTTPMPVPGGCEDAAVYVSPSGVYRVIFHCKNAPKFLHAVS